MEHVKVMYFSRHTYTDIISCAGLVGGGPLALQL